MGGLPWTSWLFLFLAVAPAFFGALLVSVVVSWFGKPPAGAEADLRAAKEESLELF